MGNDVTVLTTQKSDYGSLNLSVPTDNFNVIEVPYIDISHTIGKFLKSAFGVKQKIQNNKNDQLSYSSGPAQNDRVFLKVKRLANKLLNKFGIFINSRMPNSYDPWIIPATRFAKILIKSRRFDFIFSSYAPPAPHIVAGILRKRYSCTWIADYRDLWIENHVWVGKWPFTVLEKYLENRFVGAHADIITTVSEPLAKILRKKFSVPIHVIENGYDEDDYNMNFQPYFSEQKTRIVYTGTIYPKKRDPSPLFTAINMIANESEKIRSKMDEGFEVLFFGSQSEWLKNLIHEHHVERWVKYRGMVSRHDTLRIQKQADLLLFLEWDNGAVEGILTGKLFEYLAMRKPILGVGISHRKSPGALMQKAGLGLAVGNDVDKIRNILLRLLEGCIPFPVSPNEEVIQQYTRRKQAERLLEIMNT